MVRKVAIAAAALLVSLVLSWKGVQAQTQGCSVFFDRATFEEYCISHGKEIKGLETFEEGGVEAGGKDVCTAPFSANPSPCFPTGLEQTNLIVWDNVTPGPAPPTLNPSGAANALYVIGPGFIGSNSTKIGEDLFLSGIIASVDLVFTEPHHTGIGFELSRFNGFPTAGWAIAYYDLNNVLLGVTDVPAPVGNEPAKSFFGVWCEREIGRINIFDRSQTPAPDAIDNVQMWLDVRTPAIPASWGRLKSIYR